MEGIGSERERALQVISPTTEDGGNRLLTVATKFDTYRTGVLWETCHVFFFPATCFEACDM